MATHTYPRFPGDTTAPFVESMAHAVAARGHEVDVLVPHTPELRSRSNGSVSVLTFRYSPTERLPRWGYGGAMDGQGRVCRGMYALTPLVANALRRRVRGLLATGAYDLVHVHWVVPNGVLLAGVVPARQTVLSLHGSDISLAEHSRAVRAATRRSLAHAAAVTAPSEDLARRAIALGASPAGVTCLPYGVDAAAFSPLGPADRAEARRELGAEDGRLLVVAVGRLVEVKGFAYLVEAAARTKGVRVVIVGDGDLRPELERQARELAAPVQLAGALDRAAVARAVAAADVVAVPSVVDRRGRVDGLPNTLLEALAAGRPVVASAVGGIPDVITDGVNGLLVPQQEPEAIAKALTFLAGDGAARERLGAAGRRTVVERFSWDAAGAALERAYLAVAEQAQAPVRRRKISTPFRSKTTRQPAFRRSRATAAAAGSRALRSR